MTPFSVVASFLIAAAPEQLVLDGKGANPRLMSLKGGELVTRQAAGVPCPGDRVSLLAKLDVKEASTFRVEASQTELLVVTPDGKCLERAQLASHELPVGISTVWALRPGDHDFAVIDTEREYVFEDVPVHELSALPLAVRATSSNEQRWVPPSLCTQGEGGSAGYGCLSRRRAPSFVLNVAHPFRRLFLKARNGEHLKLQYLGVGSTDHDPIRRDDVAQGKLAVWVTSSGPAQDVLITVESEDDVPRLWRTGVPTEQLSVPDRAVVWHFPFWAIDSRRTDDDRHDTLSLFAAAPPGLFVFLSKVIEGVPLTEPLLIESFTDGTPNLLRLSGGTLTVRASALKVDVPAELSFPALPPFTAATTVDEALALAGPGESKLVEEYLSKEATHNACVGTYMEQHDPSWGKSYELVNVRTGRTVSQLMFKKADAACGLPRLEQASKKLISEVNAAQKKLRATVVADLKQRLGH